MIISEKEQKGDSSLKTFGLGVYGGGRWRSPDMLLGEVGLSLIWYMFYIQAGYQPIVQWRWDERRISTYGVPLSVGWRHEVVDRSSWTVIIKAGAMVDYLAFKRTDVNSATWHGYWDIGIGGGSRLAYEIGRGFQIGLVVEGAVYFTSHELTISEGPSMRLNIFGIRSALSFSWEQ
jgi:hypothetical protein